VSTYEFIATLVGEVGAIIVVIFAIWAYHRL